MDTASLEDLIYEACIRSRIWFAEHVLEVKLEAWQRRLLEDLDAGENRLSVRSGHGVGKTALCAIIALHYLLFRDDVKIVVTSPSSKQMEDGLIPELNKWIGRLPDFLRENLEITSERIRRLPDGANNFISFRTARADAPEALAGIHASHVMAIVDEASGVVDAVYEAAAGTMSTAGAIFLLIGNPTRSKGFFYKTHTSLTSWNSRRVSCFDSSRVDQAFIDDIVDAYGQDSKQYYVRVLGEFPPANSESVIPKDLVESAVGRDVDVLKTGRVWGIDPGRGGDPTGFCDRTDNAVIGLEEWHDIDLMRVVGRVKEKWDRLPPSERPSNIYVDSIGLGGGVADRLRELGLPCVDVNVAEAPSMRERYHRLRAELWYGVRDWFERRSVVITALPLTDKLVEELVEPEAVFTSSGKSDVESKTAMKARGVASPNLADALCLTFAGGGAVAAGRGTGRGGWYSSLDYNPSWVY